MDHEDKTQTEQLHDLLDQEREALVNGDLEALAKLLTPKEELIEALQKTSLEALGDLQELGGKVQRNQLLFDSALEGIRAVSSRLAELREARGQFETYGSDGQKYDIQADAQSSMEKRA